MSISSQLTALQTDITNARTAITNKGGTVTTGGGSSQLATDIATIPAGGTYILINSIAGTTLTCGELSYTLGEDETQHVFVVHHGSHVCTASKTGYTTKSTTVTVTETGATITLNPSELPTRYQQVEYLQSSGTQYINTGITAIGDMSISFDFQLLSYSEAVFIFGSRVTSALLSFCLSSITSYYRIDYNAVQNQFGTPDSNRHSFVQNQGNTDFDDTRVVTVSKSGFSNSLAIYLYSINNNGTVASNGASMKIYDRVTIYKENVLVGNFVPCYDTENSNKPGMYDTVTNTFFTNQGSGTDFVVGPDVN